MSRVQKAGSFQEAIADRISYRRYLIKKKKKKGGTYKGVVVRGEQSALNKHCLPYRRQRRQGIPPSHFSLTLRHPSQLKKGRRISYMKVNYIKKMTINYARSNGSFPVFFSYSGAFLKGMRMTKRSIHNGWMMTVRWKETRKERFRNGRRDRRSEK